ncbi:hypothetical protein [Methylobacterium sp. Leaf118]|uniref:hypothetical protein n=1 Tax=Methylobacterium sp. Leaf118 TaxID=2876562 RepID=UPI0022B7CEE6|nr:hypothetical protein [Methylobacterium sp. Leaf118]
MTPERRVQLAQQGLKAIADFRVRLALLDQQVWPGLLGLPDRLALKVSKAWLDLWERRELRALRGP